MNSDDVRLFVYSFVYWLTYGLGGKPFSKRDIRKESADRISIGLKEFLEPLASDCEFFIWNRRTFGNESFHSLCNRYYEKGSVVSFEIFVMKRQMAMLDWNEQMRKKSQDMESEDIQDWQLLLLNRFEDALEA